MEEKKDFKEVKVKITGGSRDQQHTLNRSMLYSGVNIFGALTKLYMEEKSQNGMYSLLNASKGTNMEGALTGASGASIGELGSHSLQLFKKLQKRSAITKIKAFAELGDHVEQLAVSRPSVAMYPGFQCRILDEEYKNLVTFFLYHFCTILVSEDDKQVRVAALNCLARFIAKDPKKMADQIEKAFPLVYSSHFDPIPEVARAASACFNQAVLQPKQADAFKALYKSLLKFTSQHLLQTQAEHKEVPEADRLTTISLYALANSFSFARDWSPEEKTKYQQKVIKKLHLEEEAPQKGAKLKEHHLWRYLSPQAKPNIRAACLRLLASFVENMPPDFIELQLPYASPLAYGLFDDSNNVVQTMLWKETLFTLGKTFPSSWSYLAIKKDLLPKLYKCLKSAGFGAQKALYENFVKYLSACPIYQLKDFKDDKLNKASFKERCNLVRETLTNLYGGIAHDEAVTFHKELVGCFTESLTFVLVKRIQPLEAEDQKDFAMTQLDKVIQLALSDYAKNFKKSRGKVNAGRQPRSTVPHQMALMLVDLAKRSLDQSLFAQVCQSFKKALDLQQLNSLKVFANLIVFEHAVCPLVDQLSQDAEAAVNNISTPIQPQLVPLLRSLSKIFYTLAKLNISQSLLSKLSIQLKVFDSGKMFQCVNSKPLEAAASHSVAEIRRSLCETAIYQIVTGVSVSQVNFLLIVEAVGLMQAATDSTRLDPLEELIFLPTDPKIDFTPYFGALREQSLHEVLLTGLSIKMLSEKVIVQYKDVVAGVIAAFVSLKPCFLLEDDLEMIRMHVSDLLFTELKPETFVAFFQSIHALCVSDADANDELREILLSKLVTMRVRDETGEQQFKELWQILSKAINGNSFYRNFCLNQLKTSLTDLIQQSTNQSNVGALESMTYYSRLISLFAELQSDKLECLCAVVLHQENFSNLESHSMPLVLFKNLFLQGVAFDITDLMKQKWQQDSQTSTNSTEPAYKYAWLGATLLRVRSLESLNSLLELRRQLIVYVETELMPALFVLGPSGHSQLLIDIFGSLAAQEHCIDTIQYFASRIVDPGEDFPQESKPVLEIGAIHQIFNQLVLPQASALLESKFAAGANSKILLTLCQEFGEFLVDIPQVKGLFLEAEQQITTAECEQISGKVLQTKFYMALERWLVDTQSEYVSIQSQILNKLLKTQETKPIKQLAIELCHHLLNRHSASLVKIMIEAEELHGLVLDLFNDSEKFDCKAVMQACNIFRKTMDWTSLSSPLAIALFQTSMDRVIAFNAALKKFELGSSNQIRAFEVEMLQEFADTIVQCPSVLSADVFTCNIEDNLYCLIGCGFIGLQKAAFVVLRYIYENIFLPVEFEDDENEDMKQMETRGQEQRQEGVTSAEEQKADKETKYELKSSSFKNVSKHLISLIAEAPSNLLHEQGSDVAGNASTQKLDQLVQGHQKEGCIDGVTYGYLLAWNAMLLKIQHGRMKATLHQEQQDEVSHQYLKVLASLTEYLETETSSYHMFLLSIVPYLPRIKRGTAPSNLLALLNGFAPEQSDLENPDSALTLAMWSLINFMKSFPSLGRKFYSDCDKVILDVTLPYIRNVVSPAILEDEIRKIELSQLEYGAESELSFELYKSTKEVIATYHKGEFNFSIKLKIPTEYPLKSVVVDIDVKLKTAKLRKWTLAIRNLLQTRNGDIISAILLWRNNVNKEIEGAEECTICYSVQHQTDKTLPKMQCRNCKNKFHAACIRKWFNTSNKSNCPLCQTFFFQ